MSTSITLIQNSLLKRTFDQTDNASQKVKTCEPSEIVLHESPRLSPLILAQLTIEDLGSYACTSRGSYHSSRPLFLLKAIEIGYSPSNYVEAIEKIKKLFQYVRTLKECGKTNYLGTTEQIACGFSRMSLLGIVHQLAQSNIYKNPEHALLELWESEGSWQHAKIDDNIFRKTLSTNALTYAAYYKKPLLVQQLLKHGTDPNLPVAILHPTDPKRILPGPLRSAILVEDMPIVQQLINNGAALNDQGANLNVPAIGGVPGTGINSSWIPKLSVLQCALGSKEAKALYPRARLNIPMVKFLLKQGAEITKQTLLDAAESCSIETMQLLINDSKPLDPATANEAFNRVCQVYSNEFTLNTPAHQMLEFLLSKGASAL